MVRVDGVVAVFLAWNMMSFRIRRKIIENPQQCNFFAFPNTL